MAIFGVLVWLTVAVSVTDSRDYRSRIPSNVSNGSKYTKVNKQVKNNISWQNPSKHVFGSLNFSLLEEEGRNISFEDISLDDENEGFVPKGVSLSFYLDSIAIIEEPQRILSVYGADILLNKKLSSLGKEECRLTVVTQLKFNITYTLDGCERRFINLDLYKKGERKTCNLYDNLTIKHGKSARGWCKYLGYTLEESKEELHNQENYTYPQFDDDGNDNLDKVKGICLSEKSVDGRVCRGITLKDKHYSLRVGDYPTEDMEFDTDSYLNGPCIDERRKDVEQAQVLKLHKVDSEVMLSHINIDPLRDVTNNNELYRRWERFELGNMVRGKLVNYDHIPYNSEFVKDSNLDKLKSMYIPPSVSFSNYSMSFFNYKNSGIDLRRLSFPNVVVSEGMFIQEEFKTSYNEKRDGKFFQIFSDANAYDVNFFWRDTDTIYIELRYCTKENTASKDDIETCLKDKDCHGINSDGEMIKNVTSTSYIENAVMWKGFCSEGGDSLQEHSKFESIPLSNLRIEPVFRQRMAAHQFRFLPKANNILTRKDQEMCTFISSHNFVNDMTALLSFTRSTDGFRLEITSIAKDSTLRTETKFVRLNESEDQTAIMHKITFDSSVESIKLLEVTNEKCHLDIVTLTADTCEPEFLQNDFGYYFLNRLTYVKGESDKAFYDCTVDSSKHSLWECQDGRWRQTDNSECPFYQCYEYQGRLHNADYTNKTSFPQILKKGGTASDECCGNGRWELDCQDANFSINYDNCTALKSCTGVQTFEFEVSEDSGENTRGSVVMSDFMPANSKKKLSCGYGNGSVTIKCDGCSGIRTLEEENSCTSQVCLQKSANKSYNFIRDDDEIKYNGMEFNYTLKGPFKNGDKTVIVKCPHGGHIEINCEGNKIIPSFTKCTPAPKCGAQDIELGPLKGIVAVEEIFAGDSVKKSCPINSEAYARIDCSVSGVWVVGDDSECDMGPCSAATFEKNGIRFSVGETALDTHSITKCYHASCSEEDDCELLDMCDGGTCGAKLCSSSIGGFEEEANFDTCRFNCTYKDEVSELESIIEHGDHKRFQCVRKNGSPGKRYVDCDNGKASPLDCVLITCPYGGGVGCVETNPKALEKADSTELAKDLSNFLEKVDLSAPKAKADTKNVVNAIMSNAPSGTMSVEDKANIAVAVDKVSMALAKSGGTIASVGVTMFGIPSTKTRKRSTEENNYLTENGIEGENFNGSVGLSIYKDKELFRPLNETKEKLLSFTVASVTTEFESRDINVNLSFPLMMECNTTFMRCSYIEPTTGEWLEDGVKTICEGTKMICQSSHLTSFAVLVSLDDIASREQSIVSTTLLTISVACLSATAMSFMPFRKLRNRDIIRIHLGLIFSSIIANLSFLSMEASSGTAESCFMSAFITHYAWLSVFGWMLAEGVTMYRQTVRALKSYGKKIENYTLKCAIVIHTVALIPPVLGTILHFSMDPMTFQYVPLSVEMGGHCFLHKPLALSLLFLLPLYLMLCASIYFFIRVSLVVVKSKRQSTSKSVDQGSFIKKQAKAISSIATATGTAWIVAAFVNLGKGGSYTIIMQWVFIIVLSSQGIITFLVLVAVSDEVKGCWKDAYKGSSIEKFGDAFISIGAGLGTLHSKRKSKKRPPNGNDSRNRKDTGNTLLEQTRSTNFFSNLGKSREFLFTNLFSKAHSSDLVNEYSTHSTNHSRSQTPHDVFSPVEEVSSIFQGSDSWVKFVERAEDGILPSEVASSAVVSRSAIASDSGFHGEEDMSTSL